MKPLSNRRRLFALVGILFLTILSFSQFCRNEPKFKGKTVEHWAKVLWAGTPTEQQSAAFALQQIGSNAVPSLKRMLTRSDTKLHSWFLAVCRKQSIIQYPYMDSVTDQKRIAIKAIGVIGEPARSLVPTLRDLVYDWRNQPFPVNEASHVANQFEPDSTPYVVGDSTGPKLSDLNTEVPKQ